MQVVVVGYYLWFVECCLYWYVVVQCFEYDFGVFGELVCVVVIELVVVIVQCGWQVLVE